MAVDLHLHTRHSDGNWTTAEVVERAVELKLTQIAITDHDTTAGISEARAAAAGRIEIIPGIEINTILRREGLPDKDVHILGYFIDPDSAELKKLLLKQQDAREQLVHDTVEKLNANGIELTYESIKSCAGTGSIGRPHITQAIVKAGGAEDVNQAFEIYMRRSSPYYVARKSVTPQEAIAAINACGGVASIAHPGKDDDMAEIIKELRACGLRAIEAFHRSHGYALMKRYSNLASALDMLITGGSDCHGPFEDYPASIGTIMVPPDVVSPLRSAAGQSTGASSPAG